MKVEEQFLNREMSWLEFNTRVLSQAADTQVPLLERLKFLAIYNSNLDEFYMKRVGGLKRLIAAGITRSSIDGLTPKIQIAAIRRTLIPQRQLAKDIFVNEIRPALKDAGIEVLEWEQLTKKEKKFSTEYFQKEIFPILTPLSVDSGHPFPFISNLSTSLGVMLAHPDREEMLFARIKISGIQPQWILLEGKKSRRGYRYISLRDLVMHHLADLFPNMKIVACMPFRITRNADLDVDDTDVEDILDLIEEELRQRKFAKTIRLEHGPDPDPWILNFLSEELSLASDEIYWDQGQLDFEGIESITSLPIPTMKYSTWTPVLPPVFRDETNLFNVIRNRDVLVHHPYESFVSSVERFVREASEDPKVLSIKMTVYRVGDNSPLIPLLIMAAESGKQVVCLVEVKARFEEERNIRWAQKLEAAGVHVVYGMPGLKIHAKNILVVRRETDGIRCYAHFGTGNYHAKNADVYTDLGLFTAKPQYTEELVHLFNYLTGRSGKQDYKKLLVAPLNMKKRFFSMINWEIKNLKRDLPSRIILKMNSLEDRDIIKELYRASQSGVKIDLIVRGICCLRPGVEGLSKNIRVISVVGRLLEHSRIFYFQNGKTDPEQGEFFMGSADWMNRNFHGRVELIVPLEEPSHKEQCWKLLQIMLKDQCQAWDMHADGSYSHRNPRKGQEHTGTQNTLMRLTLESAKNGSNSSIRR